MDPLPHAWIRRFDRCQQQDCASSASTAVRLQDALSPPHDRPPWISRRPAQRSVPPRPAPACSPATDGTNRAGRDAPHPRRSPLHRRIWSIRPRRPHSIRPAPTGSSLREIAVGLRCSMPRRCNRAISPDRVWYSMPHSPAIHAPTARVVRGSVSVIQAFSLSWCCAVSRQAPPSWPKLARPSIPAYVAAEIGHHAGNLG